MLPNLFADFSEMSATHPSADPGFLPMRIEKFAPHSAQTLPISSKPNEIREHKTTRTRADRLFSNVSEIPMFTGVLRERVNGRIAFRKPLLYPNELRG